MKYNETQGKWCKNKHGASKIIDTFETYHTSWHFYAFSRTNLLTRCHSASSLFSAIFVFQKSYTGNILGIGRNKSQTSKNLPKLPEVQGGDGEGPRAGHAVGWHGLAPGRAPYVCDRPGPLLMLPLRL
jgi:hypothetical protein